MRSWDDTASDSQISQIVYLSRLSSFNSGRTGKIMDQIRWQGHAMTTAEVRRAPGEFPPLSVVHGYIMLYSSWLYLRVILFIFCLNNGSNIIKPWAKAHGFLIFEPLFKFIVSSFFTCDSSVVSKGATMLTPVCNTDYEQDDWPWLKVFQAANNKTTQHIRIRMKNGCIYPCNMYILIRRPAGVFCGFCFVLV